METETATSKAYDWTIRALYGAAIALNLWYMLETYRDTPEAKRIISKVERVSSRVAHPWHERKWLRREETATVLEAWNIVEEAQRGSE